MSKNHFSAKKAAARIKTRLSELGVKISHTHALEAYAAGQDYPNWNQFSALHDAGVENPTPLPKYKPNYSEVMYAGDDANCFLVAKPLSGKSFTLAKILQSHMQKSNKIALFIDGVDFDNGLGCFDFINPEQIIRVKASVAVGGEVSLPLPATGEFKAIHVTFKRRLNAGLSFLSLANILSEIVQQWPPSVTEAIDLLLVDEADRLFNTFERLLWPTKNPMIDGKDFHAIIASQSAFPKTDGFVHVFLHDKGSNEYELHKAMDFPGISIIMAEQCNEEVKRDVLPRIVASEAIKVRKEIQRAANLIKRLNGKYSEHVSGHPNHAYKNHLLIVPYDDDPTPALAFQLKNAMDSNGFSVWVDLFDDDYAFFKSLDFLNFNGIRQVVIDSMPEGEFIFPVIPNIETAQAVRISLNLGSLRAQGVFLTDRVIHKLLNCISNNWPMDKQTITNVFIDNIEASFDLTNKDYFLSKPEVDVVISSHDHHSVQNQRLTYIVVSDENKEKNEHVHALTKIILANQKFIFAGDMPPTPPTFITSTAERLAWHSWANRTKKQRY